MKTKTKSIRERDLERLELLPRESLMWHLKEAIKTVQMGHFISDPNMVKDASVYVEMITQVIKKKDSENGLQEKNR